MVIDLETKIRYESAKETLVKALREHRPPEELMRYTLDFRYARDKYRQEQILEGDKMVDA